MKILVAIRRFVRLHACNYHSSCLYRLGVLREVISSVGLD